MQKIALLGFMLTCAVNAAWGWDWFGFLPDEADTNRPPRLHRLLEKANEYMELAEDASLDGKGDDAIDYYNKALDELARVERDHPDRAKRKEFAPIRNKQSICKAAIDAIRFEQVNANVRAVAVTDTTDLQKRWEEKQKRKEENKNEVSKADEKKSDADESNDEAKHNDAEKKPTEANKDNAKKNDTKKDDAKKDGKDKKDKKLSWDERFKKAMDEVKARDYAAADLMLEDLVKERPNDLNALLLRAAAQAGTKSFYAARRTLEKAHRAHPKSYLPCYNLAYLSLKLDNDKRSALEYYELGRELGGPKDETLEKKTK